MNNQFLKRSFEAWKHVLMLYILKHSFERHCKANDQMHEIYELNNDQICEFNSWKYMGGGGEYLAQLQQAGQTHLPGLISCSLLTAALQYWKLL
jgi:hypothetical protein